MRGVDVSLQLVRLHNPACFTHHLNHQNIIREAVTLATRSVAYTRTYYLHLQQRVFFLQ
jgi:hypothetical protein